MIMLKGGTLKLNKGTTAKRNNGIKHVVTIEDNITFFMFITKKVKKTFRFKIFCNFLINTFTFKQIISYNYR